MDDCQYGACNDVITNPSPPLIECHANPYRGEATAEHEHLGKLERRGVEHRGAVALRAPGAGLRGDGAHVLELRRELHVLAQRAQDSLVAEHLRLRARRFAHVLQATSGGSDTRLFFGRRRLRLRSSVAGRDGRRRRDEQERRHQRRPRRRGGTRHRRVVRGRALCIVGSGTLAQHGTLQWVHQRHHSVAPFFARDDLGKKLKIRLTQGSKLMRQPVGTQLSP